MVRFPRILLKLLRRFYVKIDRTFNRPGNERKCYICGRTFNRFTKYHNGTRNMSEFRSRLDGVGSDIDNFGCMYCGSHDRERHLYMFFDKLKLWDTIKNSRVIHFAPEKNLTGKIKGLEPKEYVLADIRSCNNQIQEVDIINIPFGDSVFDFVICNHVLEHVKEYKTALKEIHRILSPGGIAILQTPYSKLLKTNFEDENISTDDLRCFFYGQKDHCRIFSEDNLFTDLKGSGFELRIIKHSDHFNEHESQYYGINKKEDLIMLRKPNDSLLV
jgi:SAM-dependent methyltransferase